MKYETALVIVLVLSGIYYCQKERSSDYKSIGIITGPDPRMCPSPCCGGWFIDIDSITYEFDSLPDNSNINLANEKFPLAVKLDWQLLINNGCPNKRITIQRITLE